MVKAERGIYPSILFLISPIIAFVMSLRDYRAPWAKNIFWAFIAFYGFNFVVVGNYDATRYIEKLKVMHHADVTIFNLISTIYTGESSKLDFIEPLLTFLVSRFTDDQQWLMLVFAVVFGYFHSRNLWFLLERVKRRFTFYSFLLFVTFAMVVPMSEICVFRWMCASQIFLFGVFNFFLAGKKLKGLFWILFAPLMHFTFILGLLVIAVFLLVRSQRTLIFVFFLSSFAIDQFDLSYLQKGIDFLPGLAQKRYSGYLSDDYAERRSEQGRAVAISWHARYHNPAITLSLIVLVVFVYFKGDKDHPWLVSFFYFSIFFFAVSNILDVIPSVHRFTFFSRMMIVGAVFLIYQYSRSIFVFNKVVACLSPFLALYIVVRFRMWFEFMSIMTLIGNPFLSAVESGDTPVIFFIKSLF